MPGSVEMEIVPSLGTKTLTHWAKSERVLNADKCITIGQCSSTSVIGILDEVRAIMYSVRIKWNIGGRIDRRVEDGLATRLYPNDTAWLMNSMQRATKSTILLSRI
jgi:hypothetical protein